MDWLLYLLTEQFCGRSVQALCLSKLNEGIHAREQTVYLRSEMNIDCAILNSQRLDCYALYQSLPISSPMCAASPDKRITCALFVWTMSRQLLYTLLPHNRSHFQLWLLLLCSASHSIRTLASAGD